MSRLALHSRSDVDLGGRDPFVGTGNVQAYLRALHLQLALSPKPPACRSDLLLSVMDPRKQANATYLH